MTEASKQRMEDITFDEQELLKLSIEHDLGQQYAADFRIGFRYGFGRGKKAGYQAGMRDPDANAEKIASLERELGKPYDKVDRLFESNKKLLAENKKLREAMQFAVDHLSSMGDYSIVNGAIHSLREAISSGGEKL